MTIDRNTQVVGVSPRISAIRFAEVLLSVASPATGDAFAMYDAAVANGIDPAFFLAIFKEESHFATDPASMVVIHNTYNPGNCRSSSIGPLPIKLTEKGPFVIYPDWATGADDATHRLTDKRFPYDQAKAVTIEQIIPLWAPARDGNIPSVYLANVVSYMNAWINTGGEIAPPMPKKVLKIALSAGHHNTDGGSPVEHAITGPLCHFYAEAFRAQGHDVRVITPQDGLGDSTVGLQEVAHQVVVWANAGWVADLYLETHTQGLGDTAVRGCFGIYPDWGSDIDLAVRNSLAGRICQAINQNVGIPIYQAGVMSEKSTGVGISGFRLGIFLVTAALASLTTRLIIEHGAHSNPQDLVILQNPAQQKRIAESAAQAIITYFGDTTMSTTPAPSNNDVIQMNGHTLGHGMLTYWRSVNIPGVQHPLGLPISEEQDWTDSTGKKYTIQCFERGVLGYDGTIADPAYRVQGLIIGPEWAKQHLQAA